MDTKSNTPESETPPSSDAPQPPASSDDVDALETSESVAANEAKKPEEGDSAAKKPEGKAGGLKVFLKRFNLYLLIFILILVTAAGVIMVTYLQSAKTNTPSISAQNLTQSELNQIANSDATVGEPQQILNIESNAVFAGQVLIRDGLEVANSLQVSGSSSLQSLNVNGESILGQAQVSKGLTVNGAVGIQGNETLSGDLQVSGSGTFGGNLTAPQVTTTVFQLNGDLTLQHHLIAGGPTPSHSVGTGLGSGGTASLSGSDTSGLATINTGGSPVAGCFISVTFASAYASSPHVMLTPVGVAAGGLAYYVTESSTGFSICDATAAPSASSFGFNYLVVG